MKTVLHKKVMILMAVAVLLCLTLSGCAQTDPPFSGTVLAYIEHIEPSSLAFDEVEYVDIPSEHARELQIPENGVGFLYNEAVEIEEFPVAEGCVCRVFDWESGYLQIEVTPDVLEAILAEREERYTYSRVPYYVTIADGEIVEISELYLS